MFSQYPKFNENKIQSRKTKLFSLIKRPDACFFYRILQPHQQLARQFGWEIKYQSIDPLEIDEAAGVPATKTLKDLIDCHRENCEWADIVVMQRPTCEHHLEFMRWIQKELKKPVVYEADDQYLDVPKNNTGYNYFLTRSEYIKNMISECDAFTGTTESLMDTYAVVRRGKPQFVCKNSIDFEMLDNSPENMMPHEVSDNRRYFVPMKMYPIASDGAVPYKEYIDKYLSAQLQAQKIQNIPEIIDGYYKVNKDLRFVVPNDLYSKDVDGRKIIMWGGSPTHLDDLSIITNPIVNTMKNNPEIRLGMVGFLHHEWPKLINREQLWMFGLVPVKYYYSLYKQVGATISLSPVDKNVFNKAKSNLKSIEAMALGMYTIASNYFTYQGLSPDVPLCETEQEWEKAINDALHDDSMRFEIVQKNRSFVEEHYDIRKNVYAWKEAYESVL